MPHGVSSVATRAEINSVLVEDGDQLHTIRPLYEIESRIRRKVASRFVGRSVEVDVWPNRTADDPHNVTYHHCQVLSSAYNPHWGHKGTAVLVLEFEEEVNRPDLPLPMSTVHAIRTVD